MKFTSLSFSTWPLWALGSGFFAGLTAILAKIGLQQQQLDSNLATAIRTGVILVFAWSIVWYQGTFRDLPTLSARSVTFLVLSGLATGASWLCYFHALKLGPASKVAPIDKLSVVWVFLLSGLFLGERISDWRMFAGMACIVTGAILVSLK